jgi:hypothetical protein
MSTALAELTAPAKVISQILRATANASAMNTKDANAGDRLAQAETQHKAGQERCCWSSQHKSQPGARGRTSLGEVGGKEAGEAVEEPGHDGLGLVAARDG